MFQWSPSNNVLAQGLHVALGALSTFIPYVFGLPHWQGAAGIMLFALLKDFTFDLLVERDSLKGSATDVAFYAVGVVLAFALLGIFR